MRVVRLAFTLTELLVALAIVALTAAILTPVFFTARARSRQTACLSNVKQIALAMKMYTQDNDDAYPAATVAPFDTKGVASSPTGAWNQLLLPYTHGQMLRCSERQLPNDMAQTPDSRSLTGYALNARLNWKPSAPSIEGRSDFSVRYPSLTVAAFDARAGIASLSAPDTRANLKRGPGTWFYLWATEVEAQVEGAIRHRGGANYAFADGHAAWHRPESLRVAPTSDGRTPGFGL